MNFQDQGIQTQLKTIETTAGHELAWLKQEVLAWGDLPHQAARDRAQSTWGLGLMHAETLVFYSRNRDIDLTTACDEWYRGPKEAFRALHDQLWAEVGGWAGVEAIPKKTYLSLKVKKQFATWGPATQTRFEVGLNGKHLTGGPRLQPLPPGQICHFRVVVTQPSEVDAELVGWLRSAWEAAR